MSNHRSTNPFDDNPRSTNPFDDAPPVPRKTLSSGPIDPFSSSNRPAAAKSSNPFDFESAWGGKSTTSEDREPIITGMDATDPAPAAPAPVPAASVGPSLLSKPSIATRAATISTSTSSNVKAQFSAFLGKTTAGSSTTSTHPSAGDISTATSTNQLFVGKRRLARWPYDDYHLVQKMFYEKLEEKEAGKVNSNKEQEQLSDTSIPIFSRPPDPPEIRHAVVGLPLTEFEAKSEERGIAIVSTWLFDAGLIDELLANGGMSTTSLLKADGESQSQTGEGVEVGATGHVIEGSSKMDKEIAKLRSATKRHLTLINARLNDGVAASGSEVNELVNAVMSTKDDLGRLRELSTYISNTGDVDQANKFMIHNFPHLKGAINARRNLTRCFRELEFFSQIPDTCERLREQLYAGEYTAHEWSNLRDVCREHVELEIFLVEAEAGMKERLNEDETKSQVKSIRRAKAFGKQAFLDVGLAHNHNEVDHFLKEHVKNVWELGDEIRIRILSGIGGAFDLSLNNPAGMVALVEAVEVYETAAEEYKSVHGVEAGSVQNLRFTDMRSAALGELYKDMELRGADVFKDLTMQAADLAIEEDAKNQQFSAVLRAANELTAEVEFVKSQMAPCFPPYWAVETIWSTSVAHLCSSQILGQIGGTEGHKLQDLTVTQLLDLVAWVESFREIIEETFPDIGNISSKKTYFDKRPNLLTEGNKSVDVQTAKDSLAWVNNTLWDVHDLAKDEFLYRTKEQTIEWVNNVYTADHTETKTSEGRLFTSLCEDVFSLAGVQLRTIRERLTRRSEALVQAVSVILKNLHDKQMTARDKFLTDFEKCCAASNDFLRMSETCDAMVSEIRAETKLSPEVLESMEEQAAALIGLYSADAVYAGQKTHVFIFEPIEEAIAADLFGEDWLNDLTHNQLAWTLVRTLEDFADDLNSFLDSFMVQKVVEALVSGSVSFYARILLSKASQHKSNTDSYFSDNQKALDRMTGDINTIRDYFIELSKAMPTVKRIIEKEFEFLETIHEMLSIAAGLSQSDPHDFILVLQKRIRNIQITKLVVGDLYHLVAPSGERGIYDLVDSMEEEMMVIAPTDEKAVAAAQERSTVPGLRLDQMMAKHCDRSKRKRPFKANALERTENMLQGWRTTWAKEFTGANKEVSV